MEWKLFSEDDSDDFNEIETKEVLLDDSIEEEVVEKVEKVVKPANARRAIEILREQKQLEEDTWDYFEH